MKGWHCKASLTAGQKGTKTLEQRFGKDLVCVRYRYDGHGNRITTVEIVVARGRVTPRQTPEEPLPKVTDLPREAQRKLLRELGYAPHLSAEAKAAIVDKAECIVRLTRRRS